MSNRLTGAEFLPLTDRTEGAYRINKILYLGLDADTTEEQAEGIDVRYDWMSTWRLEHGIVGLNTEAGELLEQISDDFFGIGNTPVPLDRYHIVEEIGDILWYVAIILKGLVGPGFPVTQWAAASMDRLVKWAIQEGSKDITTTPCTLLELSLRVRNGANVLLDLLKKSSQYGVNITPTLVESVLIMLMTDLQRICFLLQQDLGTAMAANIAKLWTRYPVKFTQEEATCRDLRTEMENLHAVLK